MWHVYILDRVQLPWYVNSHDTYADAQVVAGRILNGLDVYYGIPENVIVTQYNLGDR